jgi:hypothetical protein
MKNILRKLLETLSKKFLRSRAPSIKVAGVKVSFGSDKFHIYSNDVEQHEKIIKYLEDEGFLQYFRDKMDNKLDAE